MDNLSEKAASVVIKYTDLDNNLAELSNSGSLTGNIGEVINYSTADEIKKLAKQGYVLVNNPFDNKGKAPVFSGDQDSYMVTFKHGRERVTADNLKYGCKLEDLQVKGTQTVHYVGAGSRTPRDEVSTITFNQILVYDQVTGKKIGSKGWEKVEQSFPVVAAPSILGYIPDQVLVGGKTVTADAPNREYTITYKVNEHISNKEQKAEVKYLDIDSNNEEIVESELLTGKPNTKINYSTIDQLKKLGEKGYEVVSNGFDANGDVQFFDTSDEYVQTFIVTLKHKYVLVNAENPLDGIDEAEYHKTSKRVVSYAGAEDKTPEEVVQLVNWNRNLTVDAATKRVIADGKYTTDWKPNKEYFEAVDTPVISGFTADIGVVAKHDVTQSDLFATVKYQKNGAIIPVDEDGKEIAKAKPIPFLNDLTDPTRVLATEEIPEIKGYRRTEESVLIKDPLKDIKVTYILKPNYVLVDSEHPYRTVKPHNYSIPVKETIHYVGANKKTPADRIQGARWRRSLTVNDNNGKVIEDGKYTTDWSVDKKEYSAAVTPVVDGYHADQYQVKAHEVDKEDIDVEVKYQRNGQIVPVNSKGEKIEHADCPVYITDPTDATKVLMEQPVPRLLNYMAQDSSIVVKDPSRDTKVTYYTFAEIKELSSAKNLKTEIQSIDGKTATSNVVSLPVNGKRRKAVVTFVDLSNNAIQIASSGVLSGNVGDKITDLYNTSKQVEELKKKGYEVVYNGFDPKGASKYFEEDQRKVATFTVAVKKVKQLKPKKEKQAEKISKKVKEKSKVANSDQKKKQNHKVLKYIFPWMK